MRQFPRPTEQLGINDAALLGDDWGSLTLPQLFFRHAVDRSEEPALRARSENGELITLNWREYITRAAAIGGGLASCGAGRGDRLLMMTPNIIEFHIAEVALQLIGAAGVSVYGTSAPDQIAYIIANSGAEVAIVCASLLPRLIEATEIAGPLREVVVIGGQGATWAELESADPLDLSAAVAASQPEDLVTLVYTSGTTGAAKGVVYTQRQLVFAARSIRHAVGTSMQGWEWISYMPVAHVGERVTGHYNQLAQGLVSTACPQMDQVPAYLPLIRPHSFLGVPRVWEKLDSAMNQMIERGSEAADAVATVGLDRCVVAMIGGAGLDPALMVALRDKGINLAEGYGLTESGLLAWDAWDPRPGTVGRVLPGLELKLGDDEEILFRGKEGVKTFVGYWNDPERTAENLDAEGWVHTGDLGHIDDDGYVKIVGRKKEILVTAGGKNVAPLPMELALKADPLVLDACCIGDNRRFISALVSIDHAVATERGLGTAAETNADVRAAVQTLVDSVNAKVSRAEGIREFRIVAEQWMPGTDLITPTGKLRRANIAERYASEVADIYDEGKQEHEL